MWERKRGGEGGETRCKVSGDELGGRRWGGLFAQARTWGLLLLWGGLLCLYRGGRRHSSVAAAAPLGTRHGLAWRVPWLILVLVLPSASAAPTISLMRSGASAGSVLAVLSVVASEGRLHGSARTLCALFLLALLPDISNTVRTTDVSTKSAPPTLKAKVGRVVGGGARSKTVESMGLMPVGMKARGAGASPGRGQSTKAKRAWENNFEKLLEFRNQTGHCNVPIRYPRNQKLALWVNTQRREFLRWSRVAMQRPLSHAGRLLLEGHKYLVADTQASEDSDTSLLSDDERAWGDSASSVAVRTEARDGLDYVVRNGSAALANLTDALGANGTNDTLALEGGEVRVKRWKKKKKGMPRKKRVIDDEHFLMMQAMREERFLRLREVGFVFRKQESRWNQMYERLKDYARRHNDPNPEKICPDDPKLGVWAFNQRRFWCTGVLHPAREWRLRMLGFKFSKEDELPPGEGGQMYAQPYLNGATLGQFGAPMLYPDGQMEGGGGWPPGGQIVAARMSDQAWEEEAARRRQEQEQRRQQRIKERRRQQQDVPDDILETSPVLLPWPQAQARMPMVPYRRQDLADGGGGDFGGRGIDKVDLGRSGSQERGRSPAGRRRGRPKGLRKTSLLGEDLGAADDGAAGMGQVPQGLGGGQGFSIRVSRQASDVEACRPGVAIPLPWPGPEGASPGMQALGARGGPVPGPELFHDWQKDQDAIPLPWPKPGTSLTREQMSLDAMVGGLGLSPRIVQGHDLQSSTADAMGAQWGLPVHSVGKRGGREGAEIDFDESVGAADPHKAGALGGDSDHSGWTKTDSRGADVLRGVIVADPSGWALTQPPTDRACMGVGDSLGWAQSASDEKGRDALEAGTDFSGWMKTVNRPSEGTVTRKDGLYVQNLLRMRHELDMPEIEGESQWMRDVVCLPADPTGWTLTKDVKAKQE